MLNWPIKHLTTSFVLEMMKEIPIVLTVARIKTQKTVSHEFQLFWKHLLSVEYYHVIQCIQGFNLRLFNLFCFLKKEFSF